MTLDCKLHLTLGSHVKGVFGTSRDNSYLNKIILEFQTPPDNKADNCYLPPR
jgi:hypothetical protein